MKRGDWIARVGGGAALGVCFVLGGLSCSTVSLPSAAEGDVRTALDRVRGWSYGEDRAPLIEAEQVLNRCSTDRSRRIAEQELLRLAADPQAKREVRQFAIAQLGRFGGEQAADLLLKLLDDPALGGDAGMAMQRMRDPAVVRRMVAALPAVSPAAQARLCHVVGLQRVPEAVACLRQGLESNESGVVARVVWALGRIATPEACEALIGTPPDRLRGAGPAAWEALLSVLDAALSRGDAACADHALLALDALSPPDTVRAAALMIVQRASASAQAPVHASALLASTNAAYQLVGLQLLRARAPDSVLVSLAGTISLLPPSAQIGLLGLIEDRRVSGAAPGIHHLLRQTGEPAVRLAALRALATAGNADSVRVLVQVAASEKGTDVERVAARKALARLHAKGADDSLVAMFPNASDPVLIELLRAAGERGTTAALPWAERLTAHSNPSVRTEAIRQLAVLSGPGDLDRFLAGLLSAQESDLATWWAAGEALALRHPKLRERWLPAWQRAASGSVSRVALLGLAGRIQGREVLTVVADAIRSADAAERREAVRALSNWKTAEALPALMEAAQQEDAQLRRLAQRGLVTVLRRCAMEPAERLETVRRIAPLLEFPEEQKACLAILADLPLAGAAQLAAQWLDRADIRPEAEESVLRVARGLRPLPAELRPVLERIAQEGSSPERQQDARALLGQ